MTRQILLVEDDPSDEKLALLAFKRCNVPHEIVVVRDGAEALDYLFGSTKTGGRNGSPLPRLVLLDLKLPKVSGLDVLKQIRSDARTRLLPVVVSSASREEADLVGSLSLGANAYVRKPLDYMKFVEMAQTLVRFWLDLNEELPQGPPAP